MAKEITKERLKEIIKEGRANLAKKRAEEAAALEYAKELRKELDAAEAEGFTTFKTIDEFNRHIMSLKK